MDSFRARILLGGIVFLMLFWRSTSLTTQDLSRRVSCLWIHDDLFQDLGFCWVRRGESWYNSSDVWRPFSNSWSYIDLKLAIAYTKMSPLSIKDMVWNISKLLINASPYTFKRAFLLCMLLKNLKKPDFMPYLGFSLPY